MADQIETQIPAALDGERVDKALATLLEISRAGARGLIDAGATIDGVDAKPGDRVRVGSVVVSPRPEAALELQPEPVPFDVLYEDDEVIIIDKPTGIVVHPGSGRTTGTLAAGLLHRYPELKGVGAPGRWGIVHRLDRDTSGAMVVARTVGSHSALSAMIKRREVERIYTTLVHGLFRAPTGTIDAPIGRDPSRPIRRAVVPGGKMARTHYEVVKSYPERECSLLEVRLETGRTHQIRVHLSEIDHPVIGDRTYAPKPTRVDAPRVFLHSSTLRFRHPSTGLTIAAEAPLPADLAGVLNSIDS